MAFNFQVFKTRALTAIVFAAVMLGGVLYNELSFLLLFSVIHFGCWVEYKKLITLIDASYAQTSLFHQYSIMLLGWSFLLCATNHTLMVGNLSISGTGWYTLMMLTILFCGKEIVFKKQLQLKPILYSLVGILYISLSWALFIHIRFFNLHLTTATGFYINIGWILPVIIIASIWINDTMQYIVGSLIGKTPFSSISPKKTWEGTVGGSLLAIATVCVFNVYYVGLAPALSFIIPAIAAIFGTLGDLLESKLKRMANVKDSGSFMPGHGGFLDRFDSLLIAVPCSWIFLYLYFLL